MKLFMFLLLAVLLGLCVPALHAQQGVYTPEPGSAERRAICDGARVFVLKNYVPQKLPKPMVFEIERLKVQGKYCCITATPAFSDGSPMGTDYIMDIVFELCLEKKGNTWRVINDISSTDVPSKPQLKSMRASLPRDFPFALLPDYWRKTFEELK